MAKFIKLTEAGGQGRTILLNINTIEYMLPKHNSGTEVVTTTNHTKYVVRESMIDIMEYLDDIGRLLAIKPIAKETSPIMEVENNENHCI